MERLSSNEKRIPPRCQNILSSLGRGSLSQFFPTHVGTADTVGFGVVTGELIGVTVLKEDGATEGESDKVGLIVGESVSSESEWECE